MSKIQRVTPFLSYASEALPGAELYVSLIPDSRIVRTVKNPADGAVLLVEFQLGGIDFAALNVGEDWKFTHAFSLSVACDNQQEVDHLWEKLTEGGQPVQCGWLVDRYGLSWQIVPSRLTEMIRDTDTARAGRVMGAMMSMVKLDLAVLEAAYRGT